MQLIESNGDAQIADYVDRHKRTPLHWAIIKSATMQFLNILLEHYPQAAVMKDYIGRTPLHLACEYGCDQIVFALLQATDPRVAKHRDSQFMRSLLAEAIVNNR